MEGHVGKYKVVKTFVDHNNKKIHKVESFPVYRNDLKFRKERNLDHSMLDDVAQKIEHMDNLEYRLKECIKEGRKHLDLSYLNLQSFPHVSNDIVKNVRYLFISGNKLSSIPDLSHFCKLEILDCSKNNLTELPKLPKTIEEICCKTNKITSINELVGYPNLKRVDCSYNQLVTLVTLNQLENLNIDNNKIKSLSYQPKLIRLSVSDNDLETICKFPKLEHLECHNNKITEIKDMPNLKLLSCDNNKITDLKNLDSIQSIQCIGNLLKLLRYFPKLEEIVCDAEPLKGISKKYKIDNLLETKKKLLVMNFKTI
jgi:Leucine-rich repeat (LRR) protein